MKNLTLILLFLLSTTLLFGQISDEMQFANQTLEDRGEFYFTFTYESKAQVLELSEFLSIDKIAGTTVYAYANPETFELFKNYNIPFERVHDYYSTSKALTMATTVAQMANWDRYPTHTVYVQMMNDFVTNYPDICTLETIGQSENGVDLICIKISDNVNTDEDEPEFFWTHTMHGDEIVAYILGLRFIDYLLSNYGTDSRIANLVNNTVIYCNPLANPDGTFNGSSSLTSISGAIRANSNGVDLNRNFPRIDGVSTSIEAEIQAMIDYADSHNFVMSANTHSGAELFNYPWDETTSSSNAPADDAWWYYVGWLYATPTQAASPSGYFDGEGGVTEGGDWYVTHGGRQDYMNYFKHCREATIEWSNTKLIDVNQLPLHWDYNIEGMLAYTEQVLYGLRGIVSDACTGFALSNVKVEIIGHDKDNSEVYSFAPIGNYHRLIYEGTYDFTFSLTGYQSQTHTVTITNDVSTRLDIQLVPNSVASPDFSASGVNVPIDTDVSFTDLSSGTVSTYSWIFEGGNPALSSDANPIINYATDGVYDVSLEIESAGCNITELKENYITVYIPGAPVADFVADVTETCIGIVQFTNNSFDAVAYEWDFGDGSALSSETNPTHIYDQSGVFTVSLTATNTYGSNTKTYTDYIIVNIPDAPATVGAQSCGPGTLSLSASGESTLQWYDENIDGNLIYTGNNLEDNFTATTTYYVQSGISPAYFSGGSSDIDVNGGNHTSNAYYLIFTANEDFKLVSVQVNSNTSGNRIIELRNSSNAVITSKTVNLSTGINTVELNFDIPAGTNYQLKCGTTQPNLWRNNTGVNWPYNIENIVSITGTNAGNANYYYYFYNWEIYYGDECISARTPVTATINEIPDVDAPENVIACDSYILPTLSYGNYFTSTGGINPIAVGTEITSTQTIYVYAETSPNCTNENSFTVTINETPIADAPADVEVCDSYILPSLINGNYFANTNGVGPIAVGAEITSTQTIYIYTETGTTPNCTAESSFTVTINNAIPVDIGDNITSECDGTVILDAGGNYNLYTWNGNVGTQTYEATTTGTYTVIVEDANGCISTDDVYVEVRESPTVNVTTTPESGPGANDATATANASGGTSPYSYTWEFPHPGNPTITGLYGGTYCVTVTNANMCTASACGNVDTEGIAPVAGFSANITTGCDNLTVQFTDQSTNIPTSWSWNFGDSETSVEQNPQHTYSEPGIYTVTLDVENATGLNTETKTDYIVVGESPTITLSMTEENYGESDGSVSVNVTGGTPPYMYSWTGPNYFTGNSQSHSNLLAGEYCVTVTESGNNCSSSDCITITEIMPDAPVAAFSANITTGCDNLEVNFTDESTNNPTSWLWEFGNGDTSIEQNPIYNYISPGIYTVTLTVTNAGGSDDYFITDLISIGESPVLELSMTEESLSGNDGTATVEITGGELPYQIQWSNLADAETISGLSAGEYCVTVTENNNCQSSDCINVSMEGTNPPVANFTANQTEACGSLTVQFTDLSTYEPISWTWNFGDSGTSVEQNPEHIYSEPGTYTVSLVVENAFAQDEFEIIDYITVYEKPVIELEITHESGAGNADGQIEMTIIGGTTPFTINWSNNEHGLLLTNLTAGLYSVAVLDYNGCMASKIAEIMVQTSISDVVENNLQIYPNPTEGQFTIISNQIINEITILDALGRVCVSQKTNMNSVNINTNLNQGVYQVKVITEKGEFVKKLVVR